MTNIAEILQDYPQGTKLYSPICGECELECVDTEGVYPIVVNFEKEGNRGSVSFTEHGQYYANSNGECLLWPAKDNHDWETMRQPTFEAGDVVMSSGGNIGILERKHNDEGRWWVLAIESGWTSTGIDNTVHIKPERMSTQEEEMAFLRKLNEAGYIWNRKFNTLEPMLKENDFAVTELGSIFIVGQPYEYKDYFINKHAYDMKAALYITDNSLHIYTDEKREWNYADRKATPEERQRLIDRLHEEGYDWTGNAVVKLPKFKCGDIVVTACNGIAILDIPYGCAYADDYWWYLVCVNQTYGGLDSNTHGQAIRLANTDEINRLFGELTKKGFCYNSETHELEEIKKEPTFQPFDKVLVRDSDNSVWKADFFSHKVDGHVCPYKTTSSSWLQCIPYEGNEHLVGTTDNPVK